MKKTALSLRALSALLRYPDAELRAHLDEIFQVLHNEAALPATRLAEIGALVRQMQRNRDFDTESAYVEVFDRGRGTSLHLFEHVHGDSRDRGPAMIDLVKTYEKAGLLMGPDELPDHLCVVLEYASTQPAPQASAFLRELSHILQTIFSALLKRQSPYASVLAALLDIAGEKAQAVPIPEEAVLDEVWEEPIVFDGCSTRGQARPDQPQPIQIVRRPSGAAKPVSGAMT